MNPSERKRLSKFLSLVLRHRPEIIGLKLDPGGWVSIDALLDRIEKRGKGLSRSKLMDVVDNCPKQRFAVSEDGRRIRANQGHSVEIDLGYEPLEPPQILYHGTGESLIPEIKRTGLKRMKRHHVHLSPDVETATAVGRRKGRPVILEVRAREMHRAGHVFYLSDNGVWLTDEVPPEYLVFPG